MLRDFDDPARDAERWRMLEAEALTIAATMTDPEPRRIMHFIAAAYRRLAERGELRKTRKYQRPQRT
jgi:hypothetical protein